MSVPIMLNQTLSGLFNNIKNVYNDFVEYDEILSGLADG